MRSKILRYEWVSWHIYVDVHFMIKRLHRFFSRTHFKLRLKYLNTFDGIK
jgi:hypothetical protein